MNQRKLEFLQGHDLNIIFYFIYLIDLLITSNLEGKSVNINSNVLDGPFYYCMNQYKNREHIGSYNNFCLLCGSNCYFIGIFFKAFESRD